MLGHINNLYNTTFWAIVHSGKTETQAEEELRVRRERDGMGTIFFGHWRIWNSRAHFPKTSMKSCLHNMTSITTTLNKSIVKDPLWFDKRWRKKGKWDNETHAYTYMSTWLDQSDIYITQYRRASRTNQTHTHSTSHWHYWWCILDWTSRSAKVERRRISFFRK